MKKKITLKSLNLARVFLAGSALMLLVTMAIAGGDSSYGRMLMGWLGWQGGKDGSSIAIVSDDTRNAQHAQSKTTPPPREEEGQSANAACSLIITNVSVGDCRNDAATGNQPKVLVAVFVEWTMPPRRGHRGYGRWGDQNHRPLDRRLRALFAVYPGCQRRHPGCGG
ncbi:MAG: hypothetical protein IPH04_16525 [Saprospirales bacterium]|nr:hypothetical protein [Saprospirales bacterium]